MLTIYKIGNSINGEKLEIDSLSSDIKPTNESGGVCSHRIENGSVLFEMDTCKSYKFDEENDEWLLIG